MGFRFTLTGVIPSISEVDGMDQLEYAIRNIGGTVDSMSVGNLDAYYPRKEKKSL